MEEDNKYPHNPDNQTIVKQPGNQVGNNNNNNINQDQVQFQIDQQNQGQQQSSQGNITQVHPSNKDKKEGEKEEPAKEAKFSSLFKYADGKDTFYMILGAFAAFANGLSLPLFSLVFGEMIDSFGGGNGPDEVVDQAWKAAKWFFYLGIGAFVCSWVQMFTWMISGETQAIRFRNKYLKNIMKQDVSWYDTNNPNSLAAKIAQDTHAISGAIGEKVPTFIQTMSTFFGGFAIAIIRGWELALICTAAVPFLAISAAIFTDMIQTVDIKVAESYSEGSALTEQAINGIKTVKSLNGQKYELKKYLVPLKKAYDTACGYGFKSGAALGILWFVILADYAIGFWFGALFVGNETHNDIYDRPYTGGDVIAVFFAIMMGGFSIGQATPCMKSFSLGKQAAYRFFEIADNQPKITPSIKKGLKPSNFEGNIQLVDVEFTYPSKQDVLVLKKINLSIQKGQKTALVGESGCGKSTVMQLIERFYDADQGKVIIDGQDIKDLNLKWLREQIGYVGQEPVLFATTIENNLRFAKPNATIEEIHAALKQANAFDFVMNLEKKLDTFVGTSGSQLSGGQKQRLCIARAILKNPQLLLLDEATSALDRANEMSIQKTLDEISRERTTIVIAHRLSTVQNSDHIIVIDRGELVEEGNHEQLMQRQGKYFALCQNQLAQQEEEEQKNNNNNNGQNIDIGDQQQGEEAGELLQEVKLKKQQSSYQQQIVEVEGAELKPYVLSQEEKEKLEAQMTQEEKMKMKQEQAKKDQQLMGRLKELNKPENGYALIGTIFSLIAGTAFPLISIFMAKMLDIMGRVESIDEDEFKEDTNWVGLWFMVIAVMAGVATLFQFASWQRVAEGLTMRLRESCFEKISHMPVPWFDIEENNPGTLSSNIGTDTQKVNALTSTVVNVQFANISSTLTGLVIGFAYDWRTTLVSLGLFPLFVIAGAIQAQFNQGFSELTDKSYQQSAKIVAESVSNIRTVYSFTSEKQIRKTYKEMLREPLEAIGPKGHKSGLAFGFSQIAMFIVYGLQFWLAAIFAREYGTPVLDMFTAMFGVLYAAFGAGNNAAFMGDVGAAQQAARNIFSLLDSESEYQMHERKFPNGTCKEPIKGDIEFRNVTFKYPTREKIILKHVSFKIEAGQKIAFVGPSGCGKSTIMQLVLKYYYPISGEIFVDGRNINDYDIDHLRSQLGVVNQEPLLFNGTIKENIKYNTEEASFSDVQQAAEKAQARKFIEENNFEVVENQDSNNKDKKDQVQQDLGSGFDRQVGLKGGSLSGGQKQRIAIARAILKQPKIMLLDEATSALDSKNEQIVQESLDQIMQNKTTLAIAHRISTIKDSNVIYVMEDGNIVEQGSYDELQQIKGFFYRLERGEVK